MANETVSKTNGRIDMIWKIATAALVPLLFWISVTLVSHSNRLTAIEASSFTSEDIALLWRAVDDRPTRAELIVELREIRNEMIRLREELRE